MMTYHTMIEEAVVDNTTLYHNEQTRRFENHYTYSVITSPAQPKYNTFFPNNCKTFFIFAKKNPNTEFGFRKYAVSANSKSFCNC